MGSSFMLSLRLIIGIILLFVVTGVMYFGFASVTDSVLVAGSSVFFVPLVWFLLAMTSFSVGALLWRERSFQIVASIVMFLPSFFFAPTLVHAGVCVIAGLCLFGGLLHIGRELAARIKVSLYRSVTVSIAPVIFALSLVISSQYYALISPLPWQQLVPSFDLAEGTGAWLLRLAGTLSPSLASLQNRNLSVDDFFREMRPTIDVGGSEDILANGIGEAVRQAEMMRSKLQLSRLLGRNVSGDESMNTILSEVLRKKTVAFVSGGSAERGTAVPFLPYFLAVLLFFTIYPIGALMVSPALALASIIFALLVRGGAVSLKRVPREQETII